MLYCPKCEKTYEDGSQRFCPNEGERLVPFAAGKPVSQSGSVFTNALKRKTGETPDSFSPAPNLSPAGAKISPQPDFHSLTNSSVFKTEADAEPEIELDLPEVESPPSFTEPLVLLAQPENFSWDTPTDYAAFRAYKFSVDTAEQTDPNVETKFEDEMVSAAETADEKQTNAAVESANEEQPNVAVESADEKPTDATVEAVSFAPTPTEQAFENRYRIVEQIDEDESGTSLLAEDETISGKRVVVKILNVTGDALANQVFAEERDRLLKLNHPNVVVTLDAGEMPDGKPFLVTETATDATIESVLRETGQFDILRAARIVRQIADALEEAHQSGVLHRNLTAGNIVLSSDENGAERARLKNFGAANEKLNRENLPYKAPEQVGGKLASSASDNYSLGVIAYQMLTNRLPFNYASVGDLLKSQREGVHQRASEIRRDVSPATDEILKKALSFHSSERYLSARDFGDAFFGEIVLNLPLDDEEETVGPVRTAVEQVEAMPPADQSFGYDKAGDNERAKKSVQIETPEILTAESSPVVAAPVTAASPKTAAAVVASASSARAKTVPEAVKATEDLAWERRSPDSSSKASPRNSVFALLGVVAVILALCGIWYYFINRPDEKPVAPPPAESVAQVAAPEANSAPTETNVNPAPPIEEIESPPPPRQIVQPPGSSYFQNSKADLKGDAAKNYLGFSLYYPTGWTLNQVGKNFLDVSKKAPNGLPVEQMLVSFYNSKGTFKLDAAEVFPAQVAETNRTLTKILPNYRMISEGAKTVNNGWQAYEVKFEGASKAANGETIKVWGRRLFIPTAMRGTKNGYVITMLATSLLKDIESVEDVGVKGELSEILATFEPNQNF